MPSYLVDDQGGIWGKQNHDESYQLLSDFSIDFTDVASADDGKLYLSTLSSLYTYNLTSGTLSFLASFDIPNVNALEIRENGDILIASASQTGIYEFDLFWGSSLFASTLSTSAGDIVEAGGDIYFSASDDFIDSFDMFGVSLGSSYHGISDLFGLAGGPYGTALYGFSGNSLYFLDADGGITSAGTVLPPGFTVNGADHGWDAPNLADPIDALDWGHKSPAVIDVFFAGAGSVVDDDPSATYTFTTTGWSSFEEAQAKMAFDAIEGVANVSFNYVNSIASADFVMFESSNAFTSATSLGYWGIGGGVVEVNGTSYELDGWGVFNSDTYFWTNATLAEGGVGYMTMVHEILHGLGQAHPHDDGGSSDPMDGVTSDFGDYGTYGLNQTIWTVMSYNSGWETAPHGETPSLGYGYMSTPMTLDIAVLQSIYGANLSANTGNDQYVLPTTNGAGTFYSAIWDANGVDSIVNPGAGAAIINLNPAPLSNSTDGGGYVSYLSGIHGGFTIAAGVIIENATGGSAGDTITGNAAHNVLSGEAGDDSMMGGAGNDLLNGGFGFDHLFGGLNDDILNGGGQADLLLGEGGNDTANGGSGNDRIFGASGFDSLLGGNDNDLITGGSQSDFLDGESGNDTVKGDNGNDRVFGGLGFDSLEGGEDNDQLFGGGQADVLLGQNGNDSLFGESGNDGLYGGSGFDFLDGGLDNDAMFGGGQADELHGQSGNDTLNGQSGNDLLVGGTGFDLLDGGENDDLMFGGSQADVLLGQGGNDTMKGQNGNDLLLGGTGFDLLDGGAANDRLFGGGQSDVLLGQGGDDSLYGQNGNDFLNGGTNDDHLDGGASNDQLFGGTGSDTLIGGEGNDELDGGSGVDVFEFSGAIGADTILGFSLTDDILRFADVQGLILSDVGGGVQIDYSTTGGDSGTVLIESVTLNALDLANFGNFDLV